MYLCQTIWKISHFGGSAIQRSPKLNDCASSQGEATEYRFRIERREFVQGQLLTRDFAPQYNGKQPCNRLVNNNMYAHDDAGANKDSL